MDISVCVLFASLLLLATLTAVLSDPCPLLCECQYKNTSYMSVRCVEKNTHFEYIPRFPESTAYINFINVDVVSLQSKAFFIYTELHTLKLQLTALQSWAETALDGLRLLNDLQLNIFAYSGDPLKQGYFRHLTSLRSLSLTLGLTAIPDVICDLPNLQQLFMAKNGLTHIHFPGCFRHLCKLKEVVLTDNHITTTSASDFANLPSHQITLLEIARNAITNVYSNSLISFTNLKTLSLSHNKLKNADFVSTMPNLTRLAIGNNRLTDISWLRDSSTLHFLQLGGNVHLDVNFPSASNWCKHLILLDVSGLPLHELNQSSFLDLIECRIYTIYLHRCKINSIAENTFSPLIALETLSLNGNSISSLQVETGLHGTSVSLQSLMLDNNPLKNLQSTIFRYVKHTHLNTVTLRYCLVRHIEEGTFDGLMNLKVLRLDYNELTKFVPGVFRNVSALSILSLHGNKLSQIDSAEYLGLPSSLQQMDLGQNGITQFQSGDLDGYYNLQRLVISNNPAKTISTGALKDLRQLSYLDIASLNYRKSNLFENFRFLPQLEELYLVHNDLICQPQTNSSCFAHQRRLRELYLTDNPRFGSIPDVLAILFKNMSSLTRLSLTKCGITILPTTMWHGTSSLEYLELEGNAITTWEPQLFLPLINLTTLMISNNGLTYIDKDMFKYLPKLNVLFIGQNRFACDCHLLWFNEWAHNGGVHMQNIGQHKAYQCASPPNEKGNWILEMNISQADCRLHWKTIVILSVTIPVSFILLTSFVVYYFRWYFRYVIFLVRSRRRRYKLEADEGQYEYDVFVAYNQVDRFWVIKDLLPNLEYEAGFKLCIHHRDWLAGAGIMENIQESIHQSRKTIAVLTNAFAKSQWCQMELTFAHGRLLDGVKDSLVLVLLEDIEPRNQTALLRHLLTNSTYLAWPKKDKAMQRNFWRVLRRSIRRPNRLLNATLPAPNDVPPKAVASVPRAYVAIQ